MSWYRIGRRRRPRAGRATLRRRRCTSSRRVHCARRSARHPTRRARCWPSSDSSSSAPRRASVGAIPPSPELGAALREAQGHEAHTRELEAEVSRLRENVMVDDQLELKIGAQVMCVANIDMEGPRPIVNGSQGIVREFRDGLPLVEFRDGQAHVMGRHVWPSETIPGVGVEQIPLIHAWAITIHKAQGVTLDMAEIDAGSGVFECGQTYVALSRVKSLEGLYLTELDPARIRVNRKVQEFYAGLATPSCTAGIGSHGAGASSIVELLKRQAKAPVAAI